MNIKNWLILLVTGILIHTNATAQSGAPRGGNASAASKEEATPVNYYTGIPSISVPIYSFSHNSGIGINLTMDYFAGGVKLDEAPSAVGLGWNLSVGGVVTRTVRGLPDDLPFYGFLYSPVIPTDPRSTVYGYYNECKDAEQDVFQFSFGGRSGKFYIGKDTSIFVAPLSKLRVQFTRRYYEEDDVIIYTEPPELYEKPPYATKFATINSFTITTEDGIKYVFDEKESQKTYINVCDVFMPNIMSKYTSSWNLSKIISASGNDSIKIKYSLRPQQRSNYSNQYASIVNGVTTHSDTSTSNTTVFATLTTPAKIATEIILPDSKKIQMVYSQAGQFRFSNASLLRRIRIMDSVFRYGYMLNWDTANLGNNSRVFLAGVDFYNQTTLKNGYRFTYNSPIFELAESGGVKLNKKDHWGYYNGANNTRDYVPNVPGIYNGANREPNSLAVASSLSSVKDPTGGITYYDFENNDTYPYDADKQNISLNAANNTQTNISLSKLIGTQTHFKIVLDLTGTDINTMPITGNGGLIIGITDLSGSTVYSTNTINLQELYYSGVASFYCTVPTGSYLLKTNLGAGTSSSINLPIQISWYNQMANSATNRLIGGIRIRQIRHYDPFSNKTDTLSTYKYITENGKSSGYLGVKPVYDYDFYSNNPSTKHIIQANVINDFNYSQGSSIGYSRVEVIKGTLARNLGKQVYEYSGVNEEDFDNSPAEYPYMPKRQKDWAWGLPKRILTYDNVGRLVQSTKNIFSFTTSTMAGNPNYLSLKTGQVSDFYTSYNYTLGYKDFRSEKYYPETGRADMVTSVDTFYHPDNSVTTGTKTITYDNNYNAIKILSPYDLNKNLNIEKRIYYPYNYTLGGAIGKLRDSGIFIPISTETWIVGNPSPKLLSLSISDFSDIAVNGSIRSKPNIKPTTAYALQSNAPIPQSVIGLFDPAVLVRNTSLIKAQQNNTYDNNGKLLHTTNAISNISNSVIYGYNQTRVIAKISNAKSTDVAYTSFEPMSEGNWIITGSAYDNSSAITGSYCYNLSQNQIIKYGLDAALTYLVTFWTKGNAYFPGVINQQLIDQRNGWNLYTQKVTGVTEITITGNGYIDELRLHPVDANMETTCYEPTGEVNSTCDANNNVTYYEYDVLNRAKLLRDKDKNILKKYEYSDTYSIIDQTPNWTWNPADSNTNWKCEVDSIGRRNGNVLRTETDINPYSESFQTYRDVFDHYDITRCPLPIIACGSYPYIRSVNGVCETGCRVTTASVYKKVSVDGVMVFRWVCTYHYLWSDGFVSPDYTEINLSSCQLGNTCNLYPI